jgi:hypothetical protein
MDKVFRFSGPVVGTLLAIGAAAGIVALTWPKFAVFLGATGFFGMVVIYLKVCIRTRKWLIWEFGAVPLTQVEGFVSTSGFVLFAAMFLAFMDTIRNAA